MIWLKPKISQEKKASQTKIKKNLNLKAGDQKNKKVKLTGGKIAEVEGAIHNNS